MEHRSALLILKKLDSIQKYTKKKKKQKQKTETYKFDTQHNDRISNDFKWHFNVKKPVGTVQFYFQLFQYR